MTFAIRPCTPEHLDAVVAIEAEAIATLDRPDLLRHNGREMLGVCLRPPHLTLGAFDVAETLAAIGVLFVPERGSSDDLSQYLTKVQPQRAANFKLCIVRPPFRGHHLMRLLGQALIQEATQRGCDGLCSTASPYNPASLRSLEGLGFGCETTFAHYAGDLLRHLYYLPL